MDCNVPRETSLKDVKIVKGTGMFCPFCGDRRVGTEINSVKMVVFPYKTVSRSIVKYRCVGKCKKISWMFS